jgi:hypothetical protein
MVKRFRSWKTLFVIGIAILIILNIYTFITAIPETEKLNPGINSSGGILAKDFSAYYIGAWRLLHDPSKIYVKGIVNDLEPIILPQPETYKYLPSFLLLISPLLALDYRSALLAFDIIQLAFLPLMAHILYKLLNKKGLLLTFVVAIIGLLQPSPFLNSGFSVSYFWQWAEGQAKVFLTFLLLLSFYFGNKGQPRLSGIAFAFGAFDPRFGLLAFPLFLMYNRKNMLSSTLTTIATLLLTNITLLIPGTGTGFINMAVASAVTTPLYYYSLIPFLTFTTFYFINIREMFDAYALPPNPLALKH